MNTTPTVDIENIASDPWRELKKFKGSGFKKSFKKKKHKSYNPDSVKSDKYNDFMEF